MHDKINSIGFPHLSRSGINFSADDAEPKVWSDADEVRVVFGTDVFYKKKFKKNTKKGMKFEKKKIKENKNKSRTTTDM